jgi:hypothetical protein
MIRLLAAGMLLIAGTASAGAQERSTNVEGWYVHEFNPPADAPGVRLHSLEMSWYADTLMIEYQVHPGDRREVTAQRLSCGHVTDASGGPVMGGRFHASGSAERQVSDLRRRIIEADAGFNTACAARPVPLTRALAGLDSAFRTVEAWAAEHPIPAFENWARQRGEVFSSEGSVIAVYRFDPNGLADGVARVEDYAYEACGENAFAEEVRIPRSGAPEAHRALARAAMAPILARAAARCGLSDGAPDRILAGFEEAVAQAETAPPMPAP